MRNSPSNLKRRLLLCAHIACAGLLCLSWSTAAFAEGCDGLDENEEWVSEFSKLNEDYKVEDWKSALNHAKNLENICEFSPLLNYTIAHIHKKMGNEEKYLFYLQKSTQNTESFSVDKDMLDRIWSEKYIAAHPEASPEAIQKQNALIEKQYALIEEQKASIDAYKASVHERDYKIENMQTNITDNLSLYKKLMWTGIGVGIGGLALSGAGIGIYLNSDPIDFKENLSGPHRYKEKPAHSIGLAFIGAGAALTLTGALLGGIFGYQFKHIHENAETMVSFAPTGPSVTVVF